jgi:hypothetical protein
MELRRRLRSLNHLIGLSLQIAMCELLCSRLNNVLLSGGVIFTTVPHSALFDLLILAQHCSSVHVKDNIVLGEKFIGLVLVDLLYIRVLLFTLVQIINHTGNETRLFVGYCTFSYPLHACHTVLTLITLPI